MENENQRTISLDNLTVNGLTSFEGEYDSVNFVKCLLPSIITFDMNARPCHSRKIKERIDHIVDASKEYHREPSINGKTIKFESRNYSSIIPCIIVKYNYDPIQHKSYDVNVKISIRISKLISEQKGMFKTALDYDIDTLSNAIMLKLHEIFDYTTSDDITIDFQDIFYRCVIDNIKAVGSIDISDLGDDSSINYLNLLTAARQYRYMKRPDYNPTRKSFVLSTPSWNISMVDGDSEINNLLHYKNANIDDIEDVVNRYKNRIIVSFTVNRPYIETHVGKADDQLIDNDDIVSLFQYINVLFTNIMIYLYTKSDFHNVSSAIDKIKSTRFHCDTKDTMINFVKFVGKDDQFTPNNILFKEFFKVDYSNAYSRTQRKFDSAGVSTIVIPDIIDKIKYKHPLVYLYASYTRLYEGIDIK